MGGGSKSKSAPICREMTITVWDRRKKSKTNDPATQTLTVLLPSHDSALTLQYSGCHCVLSFVPLLLVCASVLHAQTHAESHKVRVRASCRLILIGLFHWTWSEAIIAHPKILQSHVRLKHKRKMTDSHSLWKKLSLYHYYDIKVCGNPLPLIFTTEGTFDL